MTPLPRGASLIFRVVLLLVLVAPAGCQSGGGALERLDSESGLTLVTDRELAVYARTETRLSRSARDYVYVGPVEVNERGTREYFLWVAIASTIDRAYAEAEGQTPELLYFDLRGAPVEFALEPWTERIPRLAADDVYDTSVRPAEVLAARVTLDQLSLIAEERPTRLRLVAADRPTIEYDLWDGGFEWAQFMSYASTAGER